LCLTQRWKELENNQNLENQNKHTLRIKAMLPDIAKDAGPELEQNEHVLTILLERELDRLSANSYPLTGLSSPA